MATYSINDAYVKKHKTAIELGEPVKVEIRDEGTMSYRNVKAILSRTEIEGGEKVIPVHMMMGDKPSGEDLFIKILGDLSDEESLSSWDKPLEWNWV